MSRGSMTLTDIPLVGGIRYDFATVRLLSPIQFLPQMEFQQLTAKGLDGTIIGYQHRRFQRIRIQTTISFSSLAIAQQAAENITGAQGYIISALSLSLYSVNRTWTKPHLQSASARAMSDIGGGPNNVSSQAAIVEASLSFLPTDIPSR